jgi:lysophospholipase L1-like esterase
MITSCAILCVAILAAAPDAPKQENHWEKDICAFEQQDKSTPPPKDAVLFVGSSSIRMWNLTKSFPGLNAINRGFGGSQVSDVNFYFDRVVKPYAPTMIVFYSGDNDLASGKEPDVVLADFKTFLTKTREAFPKTPVILLSLRPTISRWNLFEKQTKVNQGLAEMVKGFEGVTFVNANDILLDASGQPRADYLLKDKLHLNDAGYAAWSDKLRPLLATAK